MKGTTNFGPTYIIIVSIIIIIFLILLRLVLPIAAYSQIPYLSNGPTENQLGGQGKIMAETKSNNSSTATTVRTDSNSSIANNNNNKVVIINFDDGSKGEFRFAKPILDKYGFKATFFIVCNYANSRSSSSSYMNWNDIQQLQNDGQDIESHTMNHKNLTALPLNQVNFEIGQSKQCLLDHGINSNIFAFPFGEGVHNTFIAETVAKYYDLARRGGTPLQFLNVATDRYSIAGINVALATRTNHSYYDTQKLTNFIKLVNSQNKYNNNNDGQINVIPIIVYHTIEYDSSDDNNTNPDLFYAEMKYLHDNGFKVITMTNLKYNQNTRSLNLGNIPGITAGASTG